jgi:uncharacterized protein (TIGR03067 family)
MRLYLSCLLAMTLLVQTAFAQEAAKPSAKELVGTWKLIKAERDGKKWEKPFITQIVFTEEGEIELHEASDMGKFVSVDKFKLRQGETHKELDTGKTTADGKPVFGDMLKTGTTEYFPCTRSIYKIENNTLTICRQRDPEKPRPDAFSTKEGDKAVLYVLERVDSKPKANE